MHALPWSALLIVAKRDNQCDRESTRHTHVESPLADTGVVKRGGPSELRSLEGIAV
jgi:hypothetical protein